MEKCANIASSPILPVQTVHFILHCRMKLNDKALRLPCLKCNNRFKVTSQISNYIVEFNTIALLDYFPGKTGFTMQIFDRICLKFLSVYMLSLFGHYYHELLIGAHLTDTNASLYSPHTAINLQLRNGSRNDRIMTILSYM